MAFAIDTSTIPELVPGPVVQHTLPAPLDRELAMRQVGVPYVSENVYRTKDNGDVVMGTLANHLEETIQWHKAFIKVFEFIQAQESMNLFENDKRAAEIYRSWIQKGLNQLRNESSGGGLR